MGEACYKNSSNLDFSFPVNGMNNNIDIDIDIDIPVAKFS
jgi:hypothetical protein